MSSPIRVLITVVVAVLLATSCTGTATVDGARSAGNAAAPETAADAGTSARQAPAAGQHSATLTLSTGESYDLHVSSCDTQANKPNSLLTDSFHDVTGYFGGGEYYFSVNSAQATASTEPERVIAGITGERDENGVNPAVDYVATGTLVGDSNITIDVAGPIVTGEILLDARFSKNKLFGETVTATFAFSCG